MASARATGEPTQTQPSSFVAAAVRRSPYGTQRACTAPHVQKYGGLDILVSNAAVNPGAGPLADTPPDVIDKILDINIKVRGS